MHTSSYLRMQWFVKTYVAGALPGDRKVNVLDIGSQDVGSGSYRSLFSEDGYSYTGLDMVPGNNVDLVAATPYRWRELADELFDVAISGQVFEHLEFFWFTLAEMVRVLKPGGWLCIIAPREWARHRQPVDTYRFDVDGMVALARYGGLELIHASANMAPAADRDEWHQQGITGRADSMLVARKPRDWQGLADPETYLFPPDAPADPGGGFVGRDDGPWLMPWSEPARGECDSAPEGKVGIWLRRPATADAGVVIFGAGEAGTRVRETLSWRGVPVLAFCDNRKAGDGGLNGVPVLSPGDAAEKYPLANFVVATGKYEHLEAMAAQLRRLACARVYIALSQAILP